MLAMLGTLSIVSTVAARLRRLAAATAASTVVAGVLVAFAFNLALFMLAFKLLTRDRAGLARAAARA